MPYSLPTNMTEPMDVIVNISGQIPILFPGILFLAWLIIAVGGYFSQERKTGRGNMPMWATIASLITTTFGFILFLYEGILGIQALVICVSLTILSALWYFLAGKDEGL